MKNQKNKRTPCGTNRPDANATKLDKREAKGNSQRFGAHDQERRVGCGSKKKKRKH